MLIINTTALTDGGTATNPVANTNKPAYIELKNKVENVIYYLNACNDKLNKVITNLNAYYRVNGSNSELENQVSVLKTEIYRTSNYLKKTVLPEINTKL